MYMERDHTYIETISAISVNKSVSIGHIQRIHYFVLNSIDF